MSARKAATIVAPRTERLYVGIDVGSDIHMAAFVSPELLEAHDRFEQCPTMSFENDRSGFEALVQEIERYAPASHCTVLMERTGDYHRALQGYLQEHGITVYVMTALKKMGRSKTDKLDALRMAYKAFTEIGLGVTSTDERQRLHLVYPPTEAAGILDCLCRRRYELIEETTRYQNRLTAICNQVFPELKKIFRNVNLTIALSFREHFPTPADVAAASFEELLAWRRSGGRWRSPSDKALCKVQELAAHSIGIKGPAGRVRGLCLEQAQLINALKRCGADLEEIDAEINAAIETSREGKILMSMPGINAVLAAHILAAIGNIANFERASQLKSFFGWAPVSIQTGKSIDITMLTKGGQRPLKKALYLAAWNAVRMDTEWRAIYERLIPKKCQWDDRLKVYRGRNKVLGRIAGQMTAMMYVLLRRDYDLLCSLAPGEEAPEPALYDRAIHRAHRTGHRD